MDKTVWGEQIFIDSNAGAIAASLHRPEQAAAPKAVVVLLHGLGGNRHEHNGIFTRLSAHLAQDGFVAIRFDFLGNGESAHESDFMTLETMKADVEAVFSFVRREFGELPEYILGLSLGGLLAAVVASSKQNFSGVVLWEPPFHLIRTLRRLYGPMAIDRVRVRGYLQAGMLKLSKEFVEQYDALDAGLVAGMIPSPVLLVQGDADTVVTMDDAALWKEAFGGKDDFELSVVEEADHAFSSESHALEVIELTNRFIKSVQQARIED